jgi:MFS family permease
MTRDSTPQAAHASQGLALQAGHPGHSLPALLGAAVTAGFEAGAIGYVLPAMRQATGASAQQASWLLTAFVAATLLAVPAAALATRRWPATRLLRASLAGAVLAGGLATLLPGPGPLLAARVLQGLAIGPLLPLMAAVVVMHWPAAQQGRLLGQLSMAYGLSFVAATLGTPWLLQWGWRSAFALGALLAAASLAWPLPAGPAAQGGHGTGRSPSPWALALSRPMHAVVLLALGTGVGQAALVWIPTLAVTRLGLGMTATAPLMVPMLLGGLAATVLVIQRLDRLGARPLALLGAGVATAGLLLAVAAPAGRLVFMAGSAGLGFGVGLLSGGPLRYAAARALPREAQGLAQGAVAWITDLGLLGGSLLLGHLAGQGASDSAGVELALGCAGGAMALCIPAVWRLPRVDRQSQ